jgi:hypothetical protein
MLLAANSSDTLRISQHRQTQRNIKMSEQGPPCHSNGLGLGVPVPLTFTRNQCSRSWHDRIFTLICMTVESLNDNIAGYSNIVIHTSSRVMDTIHFLLRSRYVQLTFWPKFNLIHTIYLISPHSSPSSNAGHIVRRSVVGIQYAKMRVSFRWYSYTWSQFATHYPVFVQFCIASL